MLQGWATFNAQNQLQQPPQPQKETAEKRELRLRKQYERALKLHNAKQTTAARHHLAQIAADLTPKSRAQPRLNRTPAKRPRDPTPLWERRLRYAVNRNLASVHYELSDYLAATDAYVRALDDDPSDFLVWIRTARSAAMCGRLHVARRAFETALMMRPGHWLCNNAYHAVLRAIGDSDEDINHACPAAVEEQALTLVRQRHQFMQQETKHAEDEPERELLVLKELSWSCLVDTLQSCLGRRLKGNATGTDFSVGHPVAFQVPSVSESQPSPASSADVQVVSQTLAHNPVADAAVVLVDNASLSPKESPGNDAVQVVSDSSSSGKGPSQRGPAEHPDAKATEITALVEGSKAPGPVSEANPNHARRPPAQMAGQHHRVDDASHESAQTSPKEVRSIEDRTARQRQTSEAANTSSEGHTTQPAQRGTLREQPNDDAGASTTTREGGDAKKTEVRRSSRPRPQSDGTQDSDRRQTRTRAGTNDSTHVDSDLVQALLQLCLGENERKSKSPSDAGEEDQGNGSHGEERRDKDEQPEHQKSSLWYAVIDEQAEAVEIRKCLLGFEAANSGPADLMLRLLCVLSEMKIAQYSSTLALLWSMLREHMHLHMPGPAATSALVAEAMMVSGRKAGKAKAHRFHEAGRLLSNIKVPSSACEDAKLLEVRLAWCWTLLHECRGEMQLSFAGTERTLSQLQAVTTEGEKRIPEAAGPELSGYTFSALQQRLRDRLSHLKSARDLEKAEEFLKEADRGDTNAAKKTVSILAASVHSAVKSLKLDVWYGDDMRMSFDSPEDVEKWEVKVDAEVDLEPRLRVFGEACAKSSDMVGELVCFSIRLRMAVHYYFDTLRNEANKDPGTAKSGDSSENRLSDLLIQIRKYVLVIKKISASSSSSLWNRDAGLSGWSMQKAAQVACITLVSLTKLIITKIPVLKFSANTELGASQKNRRLGFTRCMLAFARCVFVMEKCRGSEKENIQEGVVNEEHPVLTRKMLFASSLCLRALVSRGCCREEGTSGALMKLYVKFLTLRLQEIAVCHEMKPSDGNVTPKASSTGVQEASAQAVAGVTGVKEPSSDSEKSSDVDSHEEDEGMRITEIDAKYRWGNVKVIRRELAQCYQCLYQIPDLESGPSPSHSAHNLRWLEEGCRVSKHIGLSFASGDPVSVAQPIEIDLCRNIFFFYRKRIFESFCSRRRDGGRAKRLREVLSRLAEALPEDAPRGVRMLPFQALNSIVSDVVDSNDDISREAAENVSRLEQEWNRVGHMGKEETEGETQRVRNIQLSILYFEVFSLHALSILSSHDSEYKRHKSAERRKSPKDAVERVSTASSECLVALRSRPWSIGAWILLGRIFVEIADLALDERELSLSTFGLSRPEDLQSLSDGESIEAIFGRAEACFGFAESLLRHSWATNAASEVTALSSVRVLGLAIESREDAHWCGFGDDGDLFGSFGMTNMTSSRPRLLNESHPSDHVGKADSRRLAAIRFGSLSLSLLRLREARYFHIHWTLSSLELKLTTHPRNRYPDDVVDLSMLALHQLKDAEKLYGAQVRSAATGHDTKPQTSQEEDASQDNRGEASSPSWRIEHRGIEKLQWLYSLHEARLMRKVGKAPEVYLPVFQRALRENKLLKSQQKQPADVEPLYKLHAARMKVLRTLDDSASAIEVLDLLEQFSFSEQGPVSVEDFRGKDVEDWVAERKTVVAEDILTAMQFCSSRKSDVSYAEFYFKSSFCKAVVLAEVLKDVGASLEELGKCFRMDAAIKSLDQGPEAAHRGYFYKIWNYRFTDTGIEPAIETERNLIRWRSKLLGFYAQLRKQAGDWRSLAAIIYRLKKRNVEDLPVDGALLDDLIEAYATTSRVAILTSMEKSIVLDASAFESSYRRTWVIFVESLRLSQGVKRVRVSLNRGEKSETGAERLARSGRPRCLVPIHTVLRLEHARWKSAVDGVQVNLDELRQLPSEGKLKFVARHIRMEFANTIQVSVSKWALDEKMMKLLLRRITELTADDK